VPVDAAAAEVTLPAGGTRPTDVACYTGALGARERACMTEVAGERTIIAATRPLRAHEGLTVVVGIPKGLVREPSALRRALWRLRDYDAGLDGAAGTRARLMSDLREKFYPELPAIRLAIYDVLSGDGGLFAANPSACAPSTAWWARSSRRRASSPSRGPGRSLRVATAHGGDRRARGSCHAATHAQTRSPASHPTLTAQISGTPPADSCTASPSRIRSAGSHPHVDGWAVRVDDPPMKPKIERTEFGSLTIGGSVFDHDVMLRLGGKVKKRKKKLSKRVYGTSHTISLDEAKHVYEKGADRLIVGAGQHGNVKLSDEAGDYFKRKGCSVELEPTPTAARTWNDAKGAVIGLFHVTC
jgi:hypothetical protein